MMRGFALHKDCELKRIRERYDLQAMGFEQNVARVLQVELDEVLSFSTVIQQAQRELHDFSAQIQSISKKNEFFDRNQAAELVKTAECLLEHALNHPWNEEVPLIVAAVRYLIRTDDAQSDFEGLDGLEDDQFVFDAIIKKYSINIEAKK